MNYTGNYNLKKPEGTDAVNIDDFNNNADILDTEINFLNGQINTLATKDNSLSTQITSLAADKADLINGKVPSIQLPNIEVPVQSVNNKTGAVVLTRLDIGLGNVDNTADSAKAVLSAIKLATPRAINGVNFDGTAPITISDSAKAPISHANAGETYGLGTMDYYGHCRVINDLAHGSYANGLALSANQGYLLNDKINQNCPTPLHITGSIAMNVPVVDVFNFDATKGYSQLYVEEYTFGMFFIDGINGIVSGLYNRGRDYTFRNRLVLTTVNQVLTNEGGTSYTPTFIRKVGNIIYIAIKGNGYNAINYSYDLI